VVYDVKYCQPHQLGWLRRPELEHGGIMHVWELPDGQLYVHHGKRPLILPVLPRPVKA
jgi:hypothetical protein